MKKLKFFICFAAVLFLTTQFATAQTALGDDPASEMANSTGGRFDSDVDLFFDVNYWADIKMAKWFSFLQMDDISSAYDPLTKSPVWEGGFALQLSKVYIGLYYNGTFNSGSQNEGTLTIDTTTGETWNGHEVTAEPANVITNNNFYGILAGFGKHSIKFTLKDTLKTIDVPIFVRTGPYTDPVSGETAAVGAIGKYLSRDGNIIPTLQWGAAADMTFGKYTSRPSASFALDIGFKEEIRDLTDPDGTVHHFGSYGGNSLTPTITVDTGGINFWKGDWGSLSFGASESFTVTVYGEGDQKAVPWGNKLAPYAKFSYEPVDYFRLAAKLNVPVLFGWGNGGTAAVTNAYYFGIGAKGNPNIDANRDLATLNTGFQLDLGFIDGITGKSTLWQKFKLNWGIKVNLPAYAVGGNVTETPDPTDPDKVIKIDQSKTSYWYANDPLQSFSAGLTFFITDNILIDVGFINSSFSDWDTTGGRVLISVKH